MDDSKKTIAQASVMKDPQRMEYLKRQWSLSSPVIEGKLKRRHDLWWLTDVTDPEGRRLEYPLSDLSGKHNMLQKNGVLIGRGLKTGEGRCARVRFHLEGPKEREKHRNPLSIQAVNGSLEILTRIPADRIYHRGDGSLDIDETLCRGYVEQRRADLSGELRAIEERISWQEEQGAELQRLNADIGTALYANKREMKKLGEDIELETVKRDGLLVEIEREDREGRQRLDQEMAELTRERKSRFEQQRQQLGIFNATYMGKVSSIHANCWRTSTSCCAPVT